MTGDWIVFYIIYYLLLLLLSFLFRVSICLHIICFKIPAIYKYIIINIIIIFIRCLLPIMLSISCKNSYFIVNNFVNFMLKIRIYSKSTINHSVKIIKIRCRLEECFQRRKSFLKHDFPLCLLVEFEDRKTWSNERN